MYDCFGVNYIVELNEARGAEINSTPKTTGTTRSGHAHSAKSSITERRWGEGEGQAEFDRKKPWNIGEREGEIEPSRHSGKVMWGSYRIGDIIGSSAGKKVTAQSCVVSGRAWVAPRLTKRRWRTVSIVR